MSVSDILDHLCAPETLFFTESSDSSGQRTGHPPSAGATGQSALWFLGNVDGPQRPSAGLLSSIPCARRSDTPTCFRVWSSANANIYQSIAAKVATGFELSNSSPFNGL